MSVRMFSYYHNKAIDQLLFDLNFNYTLKSSTYTVGYLHYAKSIVYEYAKRKNEPYDHLEFLPYYSNEYNKTKVPKEFYLGRAININSRTLSLTPCNFWTLYQYLP